ncbi:MAG: VOC family protein [Armatimonadota bacterium]|nr:VOC family protein [Armatimonadota bacterium]MDR7466866.1 VOC family protein [Armatimonadota bacterium]MDR7492661.1 VOC family protein [Armatimonadota bacterium]MDR7499977.1 VOC family protein [Armatimonadota bacterium]MDR7504216.1 VOC family protein [Armatimonadota bacterium]
MRLEGIHHITAITADARRNLDFYTRVLGLRLVKKTVNQDDPTAYHLFYSDEAGSPGADLTFFEYPGARRGRAGAGMVHRIVWRVGSPEALAFWEERLRREGIAAERDGHRLTFTDPEGLGLEIAVTDVRDEPLIADHPEIPAAVALQGFDGVRAFAADPPASRSFLLEVLQFTAEADHRLTARGARRGGFYACDPADRPGIPGAGTVHHVAWASTMENHEAWRRRVLDGGGHPTPVIDRFYFRSIYFHEPGGVLFEIATLGPGFTTDEPLEHLGERLALPPRFEPLREMLERTLTPLPNPRAHWVRTRPSG